MTMPTPTPVLCLPSRSAGPLPVTDDIPTAFDPVQIAWTDARRADDLDPDSDDPLGFAQDALSRRGIELRPWSRGDLASFRALLDDPAVWEHLPEPYPAPLDEPAAAALIGLANALPDQLVRAALREGQPIGQVRLDLSPGRGMAELSYWLGRRFWGQGMGRALVAGTVRRAFSTMPGLLRLVAKVRPENPASARVLERAGFRRCPAAPLPGFDGWHWYGLRRQDLNGGHARAAG